MIEGHATLSSDRSPRLISARLLIVVLYGGERGRERETWLIRRKSNTISKKERGCVCVCVCVCVYKDGKEDSFRGIQKVGRQEWTVGR